jgi:hypothetical protein
MSEKVALSNYTGCFRIRFQIWMQLICSRGPADHVQFTIPYQVYLKTKADQSAEGLRRGLVPKIENESLPPTLSHATSELCCR